MFPCRAAFYSVLHRNRPPEDCEARPRKRSCTPVQDQPYCRQGACNLPKVFEQNRTADTASGVISPPPHRHPQAMQAARMEKQLSQKDVAQKINEKPSVLQDYEAGRAIPNPQILSKLERVLGVKLRGNDIGKKLEGPKKS